MSETNGTNLNKSFADQLKLHLGPGNREVSSLKQGYGKFFLQVGKQLFHFIQTDGTSGRARSLCKIKGLSFGLGNLSVSIDLNLYGCAGHIFSLDGQHLAARCTVNAYIPLTQRTVKTYGHRASFSFISKYSHDAFMHANII